MEITLELVVYLLGLAASAGAVLARIGALEKKMEKLGGVAERTGRLEEWRAEADRRIGAVEAAARTAKG